MPATDCSTPRFQGLSAGIMYGIPPVRLQLPEPGAAAVRDAVHHRRRRHQQRPAVSAHSRAARCLAEQSGHRTSTWSQFLPVNADPFFYHDNKTPYSANYMVSVAARAGAQHGGDARATSAPAATTCSSLQQTNPGDPGALPEREPARARWRRAARRADRSPKTACSPRRTARSSTARGPCSAPDFGTHHRSSVRSATRATTRLELNLRYTTGRQAFLLGYTLQQVDGRRRRISASRSIRSIADASVGAVGLRHAPQLRRQLQLRSAVRSALRAAATAGRRDGRSSGIDAVQQRLPGDALQPDRHVAARHVRQRRQQPPARHAGLHAGLRPEDQPRPDEGAGVQHRVLQRCRRSASWATRRAASSTDRGSRTPTSR